MKTAKSERDKAIDKVANARKAWLDYADKEANARKAWLDYAYGFIRLYAAGGKPFTTGMLWDAGLRRPPREPRALGAVMRKLVRYKVIMPTGRFIEGTQTSRHGAPEREWIRA